jgi:hypothetical protein
VQGGPLSNVIDLSAMTEAAFASGLRIRVQGGAGADTIIGSVFSESLDGGVGDDLISGREGDDVMRWLPGDGSDTLDGQGGVDRLDFVGSAAAEAFRLAPIELTFPGTSSTLRFTRDVGNISMNMVFMEEIFVDGVSGVDRAVIEDVSADATRVKLNFGAGATPNTVIAAGTNGINNFSFIEPSSGTIAVVGASVPIALTGLKPLDVIVLTGLDGPDQFQVPDSLSERFALTFVGGAGIDGARLSGDARDERYQFTENMGTLTLSRVAPLGRAVRFISMESVELDTGDGMDEVNTPLFADTALVLAGGAPAGPRDDALIVQRFAGVTDVSPINQVGLQPIIFGGFERTNEYVVHSLSDSGFTSLRDRVGDAVLRAGRFVTFAPGLTGTIPLDTPIILGGSVNIIGPGANLLELRTTGFAGMLNNPAGAIAFISGLGVRGLPSGFSTQVAVNNQGSMSLNQVDISENAAVALRNSGDLTVRNSLFTQNSNIASNSPIENSGILRLINSTIAGNRIVGTGQGVIRNDAPGQLSVVNSTIAKNISAFINSDSGIFNSGTALASNTIISENSGAQIRGNALSPASSNNLIGSNAVPLGPLANNGGTTATLAIFAAGPAHNTGNNAEVNTANFGAAPFSDQRGAPFVRVENAAVDIGAFEIQPPLEVIFASGFE